MTTQDDFKNALASWASGVTVVSTTVDGLSYGVTASSFSSVSLSPLLVMACLATSNRLASMIEVSGNFAISILAAGQEDVSNSFARSGREPSADFHGEGGLVTTNGQPVIRSASAYLGCKVHELVTAGDHIIAIGEVIEAVSDDKKMPLVYYRRKYRTVTD